MNPANYLYLSAILFSLGAVGVLVRRNAIVMFMCVELMLKSYEAMYLLIMRSKHDRSRSESGTSRAYLCTEFLLDERGMMRRGPTLGG